MRFWNALLGAVWIAMPLDARAEVLGAPRSWQIDLPESVTEVARIVEFYHDAILVLITVITVFVLGLIGYVALRFRASVNPTPRRFTHNAVVEVLWTVIPAIILLALVIPALRVLYLQEEPPVADLTVKAIGNQWYWTYEYPDEDISFDSLMLTRDEVREAGHPDSLWKLVADEALVVPVNKVVLVQVTATDVIHAWTVPNFSSKVDAVPGRLNQTWFRAEKEGTYFGQCSELCGKNHAYMPIMVRVVSEAEYAAWLERAREEFALASPAAEVTLAFEG